MYVCPQCFLRLLLLLKKYLGILLLFSVMAPFPGAYTWLYLQKQQIRKEIKSRLVAGMEKSELVLLKLSKRDAATQLHWEHNREFEYRGRMYDVVEESYKKDSVYYQCWQDNAETELNGQLNRLVAGIWEQDTQHHEKERQLLRFLETLYLSAIPDWTIVACPKHVAGLPACRISYISYINSPAAPPPKMA